MSVRYERAGAVAVLTIDRPERRNAVDGDTARELASGFERFCDEADALVLVLTGAGEEAFCAGADLKAIATLDPDLPGGPLGFTRWHSPKPTIAAVGGWCVAGGMELALWCDMRIAAENARFGFLERRWGVPLIDGGTQRLPRVIGLGRALELIITGRTVESSEALATGLVNEVVERGRHLERALEIAELVGSVPQPTMLSDRRSVYEGLGRPLPDGLAIEAAIGREVVSEGARGAARFAGGEGRHGCA